MCSGRVDLEFILRAFSNGQDGVFIGGCRLDECNYVTHGNYDALSAARLCREIMTRVGLSPERLRIEFMSGGDGILLTRLIDDFTNQVKEMGPIGTGGEEDEKRWRPKIEAARQLVPYMKLAENRRLKPSVKSQEAYESFLNSEEWLRLFDELIADKLAIGQITRLLKESPLSAGEISKGLGISPSEVSSRMNASSRHGWVRYDVDARRYALARGAE
ncbi:Methyl-viologen-reducing hydrogenase subunit delta [Candidatus Desulfarcum epimagneticum]|uniref:Methyl-viologen-reducing hydrogenase subunit delta n=1 Tax=uncultured Desulfobacteraceae bacterium TaxID=218296 RepID=A0A484HCE1_9BACT|nr:Methyl-viologen-reducing hydrogenase subunit delta [uncultured Desulfobacteraceae bacterium]